MILLVGYPQDSVLRCYAKYLYEQNIAAYLLDLHDVGKHIAVDDQGYHAHGISLMHEQISGVFSRLFLPDGALCSQQDMVHMHMLYYLLDHHYERVINRPTAGMHNYSKMWQQCDIGSSSLKMVPSEVFVNQSVKLSTPSIIKSISSERSVCQSLIQGRLNEPTLVQPDLGRGNIRVHCVNEHVFAQRIICDALDYRYADHKTWETVCLPTSIQQACCEATQLAGLTVSGIDLIESQGDFYILEVNPSPGYTYFESHMRNPEISDAITAYLQ